MKVIKYETPREEFKNLQGPVVFLAGPTVRGNQQHLTSWRIEAVEEFRRQGFFGTLILPEFEDRTESDQFRYDLPTWEFAGMDAANCVMFWIPRTRELIGLTTNFELGVWLGRHDYHAKITYGRPDDAYRHMYQDIMWDSLRNEKNYDHVTNTWKTKTFHNNLPDLVAQSIRIAERGFCVYNNALILTREDLNPYSKSKPFELVGLVDLKISIQDMSCYREIIFTQSNEFKYLKRRNS